MIDKHTWRNIYFVPLRGDFYVRTHLGTAYAATLDEAVRMRDELEQSEQRKDATLEGRAA